MEVTNKQKKRSIEANKAAFYIIIKITQQGAKDNRGKPGNWKMSNKYT